MGKNIVVFCDGTGNEVEGNLSNVLKLFRIARRSADQRVYYHPGIGTIAGDDRWARIKQNSRAVFGLATGYGLDQEILGAYTFICQTHEEEDSIFLFGFSRGAYTVRAVAGLIHMMGLLARDQLNIAEYALTAYKRASESNDLDIAWRFGRIVGGRRVTIKFLGAWDTVASVLVPRRDRIVPTMLTLPYTRRNPSVEIFRHAMAIDELRRMFRLNRWEPNQPFVRNPFDRNEPPVRQDAKQVWFAGVHADVGGGYPETESALAKHPLAWMADEAADHGLAINTVMKNHLVLGQPRAGAVNTYVAPDPTGCLHNSMTPAWKVLEYVPKPAKWREWGEGSRFGFYLPRGEPRRIADPVVRPLIHQSVLDRRARLPSYRPVNFPDDYDVEPYRP